MRKLIAPAALTLDGVMQAPGGPQEDAAGGFAHGGWSVKQWDAMMEQVMDEAFAVPYDLLFGRRTYDIFAAHWPRLAGDPFADKLNAATKHVATSSPDTLAWTNSHALRGDAASAVARLKEQDGPDLLVQGSSQLIQTLLAHDLIDEFRLWTFPVVLGTGKRLFGSGASPAGLKAIDVKVSTTGVVMATYRRAGAVEIGSFALEQPSDAEAD